MANCKSCGAPILFLEMASGKMSPVEAKSIWVWVVQKGGPPKFVEGNEPHWGNCPGADKHRKPKITTQEIPPLKNRDGGA